MQNDPTLVLLVEVLQRLVITRALDPHDLQSSIMATRVKVTVLPEEIRTLESFVEPWLALDPL